MSTSGCSTIDTQLPSRPYRERHALIQATGHCRARQTRRAFCVRNWIMSFASQNMAVAIELLKTRGVALMGAPRLLHADRQLACARFGRVEDVACYLTPKAIGARTWLISH